MRISDWSSDVCSSDLIMRMRQIEGLALPAGKTVELKPGSYHLMMTGLKHALKAGEHVPMTLTIEQGGKHETVSLDVPVRAFNGQSMPHSTQGKMNPSKDGVKIGRASCREKGCQYR